MKQELRLDEQRVEVRGDAGNFELRCRLLGAIGPWLFDASGWTLLPPQMTSRTSYTMMATGLASQLSAAD